jgi:4-hydroxybenzoate polyprenyltransferase
LSYPAFLFSATLFLYCFHRLYRLDFRTDSEKMAERHSWVRNNRLLFYLVLAMAGAATLLSIFLFIPFRVFLLLTPVALISLGYTIPCIPLKDRWIRLRDIPGIKIFLIAFVLGLTTVLLPVIAHGERNSLRDPAILFIFIRRVLFIFAITIPFDIRDMEYDRQNKTLTLPVLFGINRSKQFALLALILFCVLAVIQFTCLEKTGLLYVLALILSAGVSGWAIALSGKTQKAHFYSFYLEGTMLLQCLLVIAANKLGS